MADPGMHLHDGLAIQQETILQKSWMLGVVISASILGLGCAGPRPEDKADRATLNSETNAAFDAFNNEDPSLEELLGKSKGYAIFPEVGKAGLIAGGSYGKGEVYSRGKKIGYADITQATIGFQAGAQTFSELIVFLKAEDFEKFKLGQYAAAANVSAVAIKEGAARGVDSNHGVVIFVRSKGGLMAEASIGGQRYRYEPIQTPTP